MKHPALLAAFAALALAGAARTDTLADRKGAILKDRASLEHDPRWIYDDYERAFAEARRTGKPLLGGLRLEDLPHEARQRRGLPADRLALWVKHVGEYGRHAAAKQAGFQKDDVLVEVAGSTARETESALIGRLLGQRRPGDTVQAVVLRGGERLALAQPMQ